MGKFEVHIDRRVKIETDDIRKMFRGAIIRDEPIHAPGTLFRYEYNQLENEMSFFLTASSHIRKISMWFKKCPE